MRGWRKPLSGLTFYLGHLVQVTPVSRPCPATGTREQTFQCQQAPTAKISKQESVLPGKVGQGGRSEFLLFCFESGRRREGGALRGGCRALCGRAAAKGSSPRCLGGQGMGGRLGAGAQGKRTRSPPAVEASRSSLPPPLQDGRKSHPSPHSAPSSSLHSLWRKDNAATPALPRSSMSMSFRQLSGLPGPGPPLPLESPPRPAASSRKAQGFL